MNKVNIKFNRSGLTFLYLPLDLKHKTQLVSNFDTIHLSLSSQNHHRVAKSSLSLSSSFIPPFPSPYTFCAILENPNTSNLNPYNFKKNSEWSI